MSNVGLSLSDMICLKEGTIDANGKSQLVKMRLMNIEVVEPGFEIFVMRDRDGNQLDVRPVGEAIKKTLLLQQHPDWAAITITADINDFELIRMQNMEDSDGGCFLLTNFQIEKAKLAQHQVQKKALMEIEEEREIIEVPADVFSNPEERVPTAKVQKKKPEADIIPTERIVQHLPVAPFTRFISHTKELEQHVGQRVNVKGTVAHVSNLYQSSRSYFHFKFGSTEMGYVNVISFDKVAVEIYKDIQQNQIYEIYSARCQRDRRDNTVQLVIDSETKVTRVENEQITSDQQDVQIVEVCTYDEIQRMFENSETGNIPYFNIIGTVKYIDDLGTKRKLVIQDNRRQQLTVIVWIDHAQVPIRRGDEYLFRDMRIDKNKALNTFNGVATIKSSRILHDATDHWREKMKLRQLDVECRLKMQEVEEAGKKKRQNVMEVEREQPRQKEPERQVIREKQIPQVVEPIKIKLPPVGTFIQGKLQFSCLNQPLNLSDFVSLSCQGCPLNNELAAKLIHSQLSHSIKGTFCMHAHLNSYDVKLTHKAAQVLLNMEAMIVAALILNGNHMKIINRLQFIQLNKYKFEVVSHDTVHLCDISPEECLKKLQSMHLKKARQTNTIEVEQEQKREQQKSQSSQSV